MSIKAYFVRWQEPYLWVPLLVVLAIVGWLVIGAIDRTAGTDMLAQLVDLPIRTAYAVVAIAIAFLARRRFRRRLTDTEQRRLWEAAADGEKGALTIVVMDALVWIITLVVSLLFFWPSR